MIRTQAWQAAEAGSSFAAFDFEQADLKSDEVRIKVEYCGICHSDLSMWRNEWGMTQYPFVGGHEVVGRVAEKGDQVSHLSVGDRVGLGWISRSDPNSRESIAGDHNLSPRNECTIVGRHGGFAEYVTSQAGWVFKIPDGLSGEQCGPLFCGGATVFAPFADFDIKPTSRVGIIGIGGLGHLALQFARHWGCEVVAFTSSPDKAEEAKSFGAHKTVSSRDEAEWKAYRNYFDLIVSTVAVDMNWIALLKTLRAKGRLHSVGVVPKPVALPVPMMMQNRLSFSSSPVASPSTMQDMLEFCARHQIVPKTELFQMSEINEAMAHLEAGKARYRVVLKADFETA